MVLAFGEMSSLVLASSSPRRADLLRQLGLSFVIVEPRVDEERLSGEAPERMVQRLAEAKSQCVQKALATGTGGTPIGPAVVIAADTIVVTNGVILGKPVDQEAATRMLQLLSARTHSVLTGVTVADDTRSIGYVVETKVTFRKLSNGDIQKYWQSGEPMGKAGAYAIQGRGAIFVVGIHGSYSNVVGLPLSETATALADLGVDCLAPERISETGSIQHG